MCATEEPICRPILEIRGAFNELTAFADAANADLGVTASMPAALEHLDRLGPSTVPDVARAKSVSRQHIQKLADALVAGGRAGFEPNPAHMRSTLLVATGKGRAAFATIRRREAKALDAIAEGLDLDCCAEAAAAVAALRAALARHGGKVG